VEYQINFQKVDDETVCLDFKKLAGNVMDFYKITGEIKKLVDAIWYQLI